MNTTWSILGILAVTSTIAIGTLGKQDSAKTRIGVYDNRAVAIAAVRSPSSPISKEVAAKKAEYDAAKAAGNTQKMKELENWGRDHQRKLHFQGFGKVPVTDLLEPIRKELALLAKTKGLAAIVMDCDYAAPGTETVDVTADIVDLYKPTPQTRQMALSCRGVKPLGLVELADMPAEH